MKRPYQKTISLKASAEYGGLIGGIAELLDAARRNAARAVNALMTATYWEIGRRIVEFEQRGKKRAEYGEELLQRLAQDLTGRFGRGFSYPNVNKFRQFYLAFPSPRILSTPSIESQSNKNQTSSGELALRDVAARFPKWTREDFPDLARQRAAQHHSTLRPAGGDRD